MLDLLFLIVLSIVDLVFLIQNRLTVLGVLYIVESFVPETTLGKVCNKLGKQVGQKNGQPNPGKHWEIVFLKWSPNHQI